jgi:SulP family sulfate permease
VLLFLTEPVEALPTAVLGAVIVYAALGLVSLADWRAIRIASRADFVIGLAAMAGVIVFGALEGILIAVGLSILHVVRRSARPNDAVLGWVPRLGRYADVKLHPSAQLTPGVVVYRLDDRLFFANADYVCGRLQEAVAGSPTSVQWFVFDAEGVVDLDSTGVAALEAVLADFERRRIRFVVARAKAPLRERFDRAGLTDRIGAEGFFPTVQAAVEAGPTAPPDREGPGP